MPWPTYWLEPSGTVALGLRRYTPLRDGGARAGWSCAAGWHEALAWTGVLTDARWDDTGGRRHLAAARHVPDADPGWPASCAAGCGYLFTGDDERQPWEEQVWTRAGDGRPYVLHTGWPPPPGISQAGPGATWDAWWLPDDWRGPDGIALMVRCPRPDGTPGAPHDWIPDGPATGGGRWTRHGDPRAAQVTVTPSIAAGHHGEPGYYHGHLTAGTLTDSAG